MLIEQVAFHEWAIEELGDLRANRLAEAELDGRRPRR